MRRTLALLLTLSCSTGLVADTEAGEDSSLAAGTLLRVTAPRVAKRRIEGTLVSASESQIVLAVPGAGPRTIARFDVKRLEWSRGYHRHPIPGAIVGGLIGGVFFGYASLGLCESDSCSVSLAAVGVGAALGALPGAGIGALIRTRDWKEAEPARFQVSLAPVRGKGVAARLSVSF
jgi:hypothetical protein